MNSLSHWEGLQRCLFASSGSSCVLCLGRLSSSGTGRASDIGAAQGGASKQQVYFPFPFPLFFVFCSVTLSVLLSLINTLLFTLVVSLCRAFFLPRQSIYLWLASSSRAAPGVKWRAVGGRARELATWRSGPSHVGMTPSTCCARTRTQTRCWCSQVILTDFKIMQLALFDNFWQQQFVADGYSFATDTPVGDARGTWRNWKALLKGKLILMKQ